MKNYQFTLSKEAIEILKRTVGQQLHALEVPVSDYVIDRKTVSTSHSFLILNLLDHPFVYMESDHMEAPESAIDYASIEISEQDTPAPFAFYRDEDNAGKLAYSKGSTMDRLLSTFFSKELVDITETVSFDYAIVFVLKDGRELCISFEGFFIEFSWEKDVIAEKTADCQKRYCYPDM